MIPLPLWLLAIWFLIGAILLRRSIRHAPREEDLWTHHYTPTVEVQECRAIRDARDVLAESEQREGRLL